MKIINNPFRFFSFIVTLLVLITGCSSGGGDSGAAPSTSYPSVAGVYALNTGTIAFTCTDGSSGSGPPIALNMRIIQNNNMLTMESTSGSSIPGITIIDANTATGNVAADSSFIINQVMTANIQGISGTVTLNFSLTGSFTGSGWSGTYTYSASAPSLGGSCTYVTSFSGAKTATGIQIDTIMIDLNELPPDIYDTYGHIGRSIAQ